MHHFPRPIGLQAGGTVGLLLLATDSHRLLKLRALTVRGTGADPRSGYGTGCTPFVPDDGLADARLGGTDLRRFMQTLLLLVEIV